MRKQANFYTNYIDVPFPILVLSIFPLFSMFQIQSISRNYFSTIWTLHFLSWYFSLDSHQDNHTFPRILKIFWQCDQYLTSYVPSGTTTEFIMTCGVLSMPVLPCAVGGFQSSRDTWKSSVNRTQKPWWKQYGDWTLIFQHDYQLGTVIFFMYGKVYSINYMRHWNEKICIKNYVQLFDSILSGILSIYQV